VVFGACKVNGLLTIDKRHGFTNFELGFATEPIDATVSTPLRVPDSSWHVFDRRGHYHAWSGDELPTLKAKIEEFSFSRIANSDDDFDDEEFDATRGVEYECLICGQSVAPQYKVHSSTRRQYMAGMSSWNLTITSVSGRLPLIFRERTVSIRIDDGTNVRFGIAQIDTVRNYQPVGDASYWTVRYIGISPLGTRVK
jgi:hypothetical protein